MIGQLFERVRARLFSIRAINRLPVGSPSKELYFSFERMGLVATPSSIHYAMLLHEVLRDGNTLSNTEGTSGGESEEPSRNARRGVLLVGPSGVGHVF